MKKVIRKNASKRKIIFNRPPVCRSIKKQYLFETMISEMKEVDKEMIEICSFVVEMECQFRINGIRHQDPVAVLKAAEERNPIGSYENIIEYFNQYYHQIRPIDTGQRI